MASVPTITDTPVGSGYIELSRADSQLFMGSTGYQRNLCDAGSGATQTAYVKALRQAGANGRLLWKDEHGQFQPVECGEKSKYESTPPKNNTW